MQAAIRAKASACHLRFNADVLKAIFCLSASVCWPGGHKSTHKACKFVRELTLVGLRVDRWLMNMQALQCSRRVSVRQELAASIMRCLRAREAPVDTERNPGLAGQQPAPRRHKLMTKKQSTPFVYKAQARYSHTTMHT